MLPLVMVALSAAPEAMTGIDALEALSKYGTVPECRAEESIHTGDRGGFDHQHSFSPPKPRFAGKANQLLPFSRHRDRQVVLRAAQLLCFEGSKEAVARLTALAEQWPCEVALRSAAQAHGAMPKATCPEGDGERWSQRDRSLLFASPEMLGKWTQTPDAALLARLNALDPKAWAEAMDSLDLIDRARSKTVVKTLGALDSPAALRRLLGEGATVSQRSGGQRQVGELLEGVGLTALGALAKKLGKTPPEALLEVVRTATAADVPVLGQLSLNSHRLTRGQWELARPLLNQPGTTPEGRTLLESLVQTSPVKADSHFERRKQLEEFERYHDRPALRAFAQDTTQLHVDRRTAAALLAGLGDASGLVLWESTAGLTAEERDARKNELGRLLRTAQGPAQAEARRLYEGIWNK